MTPQFIAWLKRLSHCYKPIIPVMKINKIILGLVLLSFSLGVVTYNHVQNLSSQVLIDHGRFTVKKGETFQSVATRLAYGANPTTLGNYRVKLFGSLNSELTNVKSGVYEFNDVNTVGEALDKINKGLVVYSQVLLIPGQTWKQWNATFAASKDYKNDLAGLDTSAVISKIGLKPIAGDEKFNNLEGYFFPDTYHIGSNGDVSSALKVANDTLNKELQAAWEARDKNQVKLNSPYELLIMASLIEKEKGNNEEASLIASVFYNRIAKGMLLQTDPTVIYGLGDKYKGNLTRKDLETPTPYNTYTNKGLPPTPIAMVTKNSLWAAAQPATSDFYYFVAVYGESRHNFSRNLDEHNKRVQEYVRAYRTAQSKLNSKK